MNLRNKKNWQLRKILQTALGFPLTIVAFYFIISFIWKSYPKISHNIHSLNLIPLILGTIMIVIFFALKSYCWLMILSLYDQRISYRKSSYLLTLSELKRYIPGNVFGFISRAHHFNKEKIKKRTTASAIVLESILLLIGSLIVSLPSVIYFFPVLTHNIPTAPLVISLLLLVTGGASALYILKRKFVNQLPSIQYRRNIFPLINIIALITLAWVFFGAGNYLIAASFVWLDPTHILVLSSVFVLAWMIGYLSIITPMGLGVREAIIILGLSPFVPLYIASSLAILLRVAFIIAEVIFLAISFIFNKIRITVSQFPSHLSILSVCVLTYITYFIYFTLEKHTNFFTGRFDLGNMDQTVWNTIHGRIFVLTDPNGTENILRLAFHADFILILLSPLYYIWSDPRMLLIVQTIVLACGAFFVYVLANQIIKNKNIALALGISWLLNPFIQRQNLYDFHAVVFVSTFFIASFYFLNKKRWGLFVLFLILAALTKENIYLITTLIGFYVLFIQKKLKLGALIVVISITTFVLLTKNLIPAAQGENYFALKYLSEFGDSVGGILFNITTHPIKTFSIILKHGGVSYVMQLLLPLGFSSLGAPLYLLFAVPDTAKNLLSNNPNLRSFNYQYTAELVPFIYLSSIYGIRRLLAIKTRLISSQILFYWIIIFAIYGQWRLGALPGAKYAELNVFNHTTPHAAQINAYLQTIPLNASVSATNNLGAHLSERRKIYTIPVGINQAQYVVFLLDDPYAKPSPKEQRKLVNKLQQNKKYKLQYHIENFYAFKKGNPTPK